MDEGTKNLSKLAKWFARYINSQYDNSWSSTLRRMKKLQQRGSKEDQNSYIEPNE